MPEAEGHQPEAEVGEAAGTPSRKAQSSLEGAPASPSTPGEETPAAPGRESEEAAEEDLDRLLDETKRERDEYLDLAQRTRADFENYRKRMAAETQAAAARGRSDLAGELIGVVDNLERALEAADLDPEAALNGEAAADRPLEEGILLTYRELTSALRRAGVEPYDPAGETFDPAWHEALGTRPAGDGETGRVVEVLQKGYRLDGQVLRAARVMVSE